MKENVKGAPVRGRKKGKSNHGDERSRPLRNFNPIRLEDPGINSVLKHRRGSIKKSLMFGKLRKKIAARPVKKKREYQVQHTYRA